MAMRRELRRWLAGLGIIWLLAGPVLAAPNYQDPAYLAAVADASVRTAAEISNQLTAIAAWNPSLTWEGTPGASRVLMTTVTREYYDQNVGKEYNLSFGQLWVTAAGELRNWFAGSAGGYNELRLEQLMGFPPGIGYTRVVELWVDPATLFRPTPDPEVSDTTCGLDYPTGLYQQVSAAYREWFDHRATTIYSGSQPWPWTGLGYTYDWGDTTGHVGLSEFVVEQNATVKIEAVYTMDQYFRPVR